MRDIRVLVADDSAVIRKVIADVVNGEPGMRVCGTAENGRVAIERVMQLRPDVVTLDIEMPVLSGLDALDELHRRFPELPVIMFSTLTVNGGKATLEALSRGASDFVTKPSGPGGLSTAVHSIRADLVSRIRALAGRRDGVPRAVAPAARTSASARALRPTRIDCVAIAVSTGGPRALEQLVPALPSAFPVPVFVVQHMPATFTRLLADRLDRTAAVPVSEATHGECVHAGRVYVAAGEHHLLVTRSQASVRLGLDDGPPENSCRPAADVLFRSVAEVYGANALAVVLTGMGEDGCSGARAIADAGGHVLAQDEASSTVWGMPGAVVRAGLADAQIALGDIAAELERRARTGR